FVKCSDITLRSGGINPIIHSCDIGGLGTPTGSDCYTDSIGIYLFPGQQIIHRPDAVPNEEIGGRNACQKSLGTGVRMFSGSRQPGFPFFIQIPNPFTLTDRIKCEYRKTFFDIIEYRMLIALASKTFCGMSAAKQNGRQFTGKI